VLQILYNVNTNKKNYALAVETPKQQQMDCLVEKPKHICAYEERENYINAGVTEWIRLFIDKHMSMGSPSEYDWDKDILISTILPFETEEGKMFPKELGVREDIVLVCKSIVYLNPHSFGLDPITAALDYGLTAHF